MSLIRETNVRLQTASIVSQPVIGSGSLDVTVSNLSIPVQITNMAALEITSGQLNVAIRTPSSATNEMLVAIPHPTVQIDFLNGIDASATKLRFISGGVITAQNGLLSVSGNGGTARLESQRVQAYRPCQSMQARISAQFSVAGNGVAYAGPINAESGCAVGYKGGQFGFFTRAGGKRQINVLQITGAAIPLTGYSITLNGVSTIITVGGGGAEVVADQIARLNWAPNITGLDGLGYTVMAESTRAHFLAEDALLKPGVFDSGITGVGYSSLFETVRIGAPPASETFVPKSAWNVDPMDGLIGSAFELDPLAGNLYNIVYQAAGYGMNVLQVMDPKTGVWVTTHRQKNTPAAFNPRTSLQFYASENAALNSTSAAAFIDGDFQLLGPTYSVSRLGVKASASAGTWYSVFTIRNDLVFNGLANYKLANLTHLTFKVKDSSLCLVRLVKNAAPSSTTFYAVATGKSIVSADYTSEADTAQAADFVSTSGTVITFTKNQFIMNPGDFVTLAFQPQIAGDYDIAASLAWIEN